MNHYTLPLHGLNCMGCANKVKRALVEHSESTVIDISPTMLQVDTPLPLTDIINTVESLGYHAGDKVQFSLSGLSCGRCVKKLSQHLEQHPHIGVFSVTTTELTLVTDLKSQQIIDLVASVGYQASPLLESETSDKQTVADEQSIAEKVITSTPLASEALIAEPHSDAPPAKTQPNHSYHLLLQGLTCASCVSSVEKACLSVEAVSHVQINLAEQSALVFSVSEQEVIQTPLIAAIEAAGYHAEFVHSPEIQQQKQLEQQQEEQKIYRKNAITALLLGAPLMLWGVLGGNMMIRTTHDQLIWGMVGLLCLWLLATSGKHFFINAWKSVLHKRATMDTLVALGTGAAWLYSIFVVLIPDWFPIASRHVYFEASAMIIGLISLGHYIEAKAKARTTQSLQALINLQPQQATLVNNGSEQSIAVEAIQLGMQLRIRPGEKVPVDGKVVDGESYLDESMLTGEPVPAVKALGDALSAGTINGDGNLLMEATGVGSDTMLARIIQMVRQAQSSKPAIAKLADSISAVFVPVVVAIAVLSALIWFWVGPDPKASYMLVVATTVLIIACPCALGLATPLSVTVGVGKAAELGILIKDANALQSASKINTVVFDKTGTLTQGKPSVQRLFSFNIEDNDLLTLAYSAERHSEHPLAKAVCQYAQERHLEPLVHSQFSNLRGKGIQATIDSKDIIIASLQHAETLNADLSEAKHAISQCKKSAWTPVVVIIDNQLSGIIAISDPIKSDAKLAITQLKQAGIRTVMLTGDSQHVAKAIADELGLDHVIAQVLPDEKAQHIEQLQLNNGIVAMVGDGINDAPALAQADVGIAMGSGSDVAIESAQMTLLNSSPIAVLNAIELSKATVRNMQQNLFGAFIYNSLGIPIAAGVLYPFFGFLLSPVVAGAAMALSSITVVSNANRLRLFKPQTHDTNR
ncbi:heavy metal translocating P-type ATPase [Vibrio genomosp. F6]|uniref:Copper-exporting P-type ATPase n=1 Tax=Vibrio genomosp. F6 str. FF-238 TaxID=1191298 RepID=A0A1E5DCE8_9VIBR|nr:heavy metal translocating P-type ATPase [Vibrio genomosp. F6]OEE81208.1 copper-translocating P-type ATPase [Vibrio genomosp. F6 str. FF-238]